MSSLSGTEKVIASGTFRTSSGQTLHIPRFLSYTLFCVMTESSPLKLRVSRSHLFWLKMLYVYTFHNVRPLPAKSHHLLSPQGEGAAKWNSSETCSTALQRSVLQAEHRMMVCGVCMRTRRHRGRLSVRKAADRPPGHENTCRLGERTVSVSRLTC
jgi:hypothetical protein